MLAISHLPLSINECIIFSWQVVLKEEGATQPGKEERRTKVQLCWCHRFGSRMLFALICLVTFGGHFLRTPSLSGCLILEGNSITVLSLTQAGQWWWESMPFLSRIISRPCWWGLLVPHPWGHSWGQIEETRTWPLPGTCRHQASSELSLILPQI